MRIALREILGTLILAIVLFLILQVVVQDSVIISGSMESTLQIGQRLLINKVVYKFHEPERGDIITFHPPNSPKETFIKRIIGLPGESVEIRDGIVYIHQNGNVIPLDEPYIKDPPRYTYERDIIPKDEYFVLGDNRNNSSDSHYGWTVKREDIIGKAWLSIWPPGEWGLAPNYSLEE